MAPSVNIVGAGIGGLAVGRALLDDGWQVSIFERSSGLPQAGTALGIWPEALRALDRLGLGDQVRKRGVRQQGAKFLRRDGTVFARIVSKDPAYLVSRPVLHEILFRRSLESHVTWGSSIGDPRSLPAADLTIGADGIHSRVRRLVNDRETTPRSLNSVAFRGVIPGSVETVTETWGAGRLFGITPQDGDMTNWFACVREEILAESQGAQSDAELLAKLFGRWHPAVAEVVNKLDTTAIDRREMYDLAPPDSMVRGRTAILGDAAHAMAPNAGRGACEALMDAISLADSLQSAASIEAGLRDFNRSRLGIGRRTVRLSRVLNRLATSTRFLRVRQEIMGILTHFA